MFSTLSLLGSRRQAHEQLQHCLGVFTFTAGVWRSLFSVLQASYQEVTLHEHQRPFSSSTPTVTELIVTALVALPAITE